MFGINTAKDRLKSLKSNYDKLLEEPLNISLAEQTCSDAWHLTDWVLEENKKLDSSLTKEKFRKDLYAKCPEFKILHDLVNTFKHKVLSRPKAQIKKTDVHSGPFSSTFSKEFDVSRLTVHYDNKQIDVDDLVKIAINYWDNLLK
ncbi:hypothetical protein [Tenacibaculum agarivorans]|uniref:hypothetical protein n=1 Tax=Tenacibaculum agarivorans TaxID=1908389 RepID=UPI00094B9324|nr:hypothetical protein [Tenacibaculum agarivorans]